MEFADVYSKVNHLNNQANAIAWWGAWSWKTYHIYYEY